MEKEIDSNFKKQFKLTFIKSLKLGFKINDIKKELKKQAYSNNLIDQLIKEAESDKDIQNLMDSKKPSFFEKLFKMDEATKIKKVTKIHNIYYNLIIDIRRKLNEESSNLKEILENIENKKLIIYFIKTQKAYLDEIQKKTNSILKLTHSLVDKKLDQELKNQVNKILVYLEKREIDSKKEIENLKDVKSLINLPEELKQKLQILKNNLKVKEKTIENIIKDISNKSSKFKEIISEL